MTVKYQGKEYEVVDKIKVDGDNALVLLEHNYILHYENEGIDGEDSVLRFDDTPVKMYENGWDAIHIINNETGYGVGLYGIMEDDPELVK
jgi:hypothetical protein